MTWKRATTAAGPAAGGTGRTAADTARAAGDRRAAIIALAVAGTLWGLTVPLSKLGLDWLGAGWLAVARFAIAAPLLALFARRGLRAALTPGIVVAGALGYGVVIVLQNAGIERTSVSHAALIVGAVPVLVAVIAALSGRASTGRLAWAGSLLALAGVGLVAGGGGSGTSVAGDLLVLLSVTGSAGFIVAQPGLLAGRDPAAVTAVQLGAGGLAALPVAIVLEGAPPAPTGAEPLVAVLLLALTGTLLAFWLFAWAQARVPAALAGVFVNLEPLVGALTGAVAFHDALGRAQIIGGAAILAGIALGALPRAPKGGALRDARPAHGRARPEMHRPTGLRRAHERLRGGRQLEDRVRVRGRGGVGGDGVRVRPLHRLVSALHGHREDAHGGIGLDFHAHRIGCKEARHNP
jgi:O-acetylserine/cysteine efflux transporter